MKPFQMSLFDTPTLNVTRPLKEALHAAAKNCGLSRDEIVDRMNDLAERYGVSLASGNGKQLTRDIFEKWVNPQDTSRQVPVKALPIFCAIVKDITPFDILVKPLGAEVIGHEECRKLRWADAKLNVRKENKVIREIEKELE